MNPSPLRGMNARHALRAVEDTVHEELVWLWQDLHYARIRAQGLWSMTCDNIESRIINLIALVGASNWRSVPPPLVVDGTYRRVCAQAGAALTDEPDGGHADAHP